MLAFLILLDRRLCAVSGWQRLFIYVGFLVDEGVGDEVGLREGDRKCHYVPMAAAEPRVVRIGVEHERLEAEHLKEPLVVHLPGVEYCWQSEDEGAANEDEGCDLDGSQEFFGELDGKFTHDGPAVEEADEDQQHCELHESLIHQCVQREQAVHHPE